MNYVMCLIVYLQAKQTTTQPKSSNYDSMGILAGDCFEMELFGKLNNISANNGIWTHANFSTEFQFFFSDIPTI